MKAHLGRFPKDPDAERKLEVKIDKFDTWNADHTIAVIVWPLLQQLKDDKAGCPSVDDQDVPFGLQRSQAEVKPENDWDTDSNWQARWEYVLDEMIWGMREIALYRPGQEACYDSTAVDHEADIMEQVKATKVDWEQLDKYDKRVQNSCVLFGKYLQALWT